MSPPIIAVFVAAVFAVLATLYFYRSKRRKAAVVSFVITLILTISSIALLMELAVQG
jgi:ABC-type proline/glycine betaine transport system permease subunit